MKKLICAATAVAALLSSASAMATAVGSNYTFYFTGNCVDCARDAKTEAYPVQATLQVVDYQLGTELKTTNFFQFDYAGSNLLDPYTITLESIQGFSGLIGALDGPYEVQIFAYPLYFSSYLEGGWQTGVPTLLPADYGDGGTWSLAAAPTGEVPEPATWAMMITGFAMAGAAMRRRTAVRYDFA